MDIRRAVGMAGLGLLLVACEREEKMVREDLPMARTTKARSDAQAIATAVNTYRASCGGTLPESLEALTTQTDGGRRALRPDARLDPDAAARLVRVRLRAPGRRLVHRDLEQRRADRLGAIAAMFRVTRRHVLAGSAAALVAALQRAPRIGAQTASAGPPAAQLDRGPRRGQPHPGGPGRPRRLRARERAARSRPRALPHVALAGARAGHRGRHHGVRSRIASRSIPAGARATWSASSTARSTGCGPTCRRSCTATRPR